MNVKLIEIPDVKPEWETVHKIRALEIDGRSPVLDELSKWKRNEPADYKKIIKVMRLVGIQNRVRSSNHVGRAQGYDGIYYMRAHRGHARVNFFYDNGSGEVVICTNAYWKAKPSRSEQNKSFGICANLREIYYRYCRQGYNE